MAGDAARRHFDFHPTAMAAVNAARSRFGDDDEFGANFVFLNDILPRESVAVFFLHGTRHNQRVVVFKT